MFKYSFRLPAQTKLTRPVTYPSASFFFKYAKNNLPYSRFGFIISKKVDKRSVKRNQIKRRLRACLEKAQSQIVIGYDMLFILNQNAKDKTWEEMQEEVKSTLAKKGLLL